MDTTALIVEAASTAGIAGSAMPDVLNRSSRHFSAKEVTPESVQAFLTELREEAAHLFAPAAPGPGAVPGTTPPDWLSPSEKLTWARTHQPQAPVQRRPVRYDPSPEQLKSLEGKTAAERLTAYRQWQAEATGGSV